MLQVHFLTIVLNGQPFIGYHLDVFRRLPFPWRWHIVEGVAELVNDSSWCARRGGRVPHGLHRDGLSVDGTTEYLDRIRAEEPERVFVYRKPRGDFWQGKVEMVSAPLPAMTDECLLWQVDSDELWTAEQIVRARRMFVDQPTRTAALFLCHFFVGPALATTTVDSYGNYRGYEWLRAWRYRPGDFWHSHVPPRLGRPLPDGTVIDVGAADPFFHEETAAAGLVFQHYAYATREQAAFKESYYGYDGAVRQWEALQASAGGPRRLRDFFAWVEDGAVVDRVERSMATPLARPGADGTWSFVAPSGPATLAASVALLRDAEPGPRRRTLNAGDPPPVPTDLVRSIGVFLLDGAAGVLRASAFLRELRRAFPLAHVTVFSSPDAEPFLRLCPYVNQRVNVPSLAGRAPGDPLVGGVCREIGAGFRGAFELTINPRWGHDDAFANRLMKETGALLRVGYRIGRPIRGYYADAFLTHAVADPGESLRGIGVLQALVGGAPDAATEVWASPQGEGAAAAVLAAGPQVRWRCVVGLPDSPPDEGAALSDLCRRLAARGDVGLFLVGPDAARPAADGLIRDLGRYCVDAVGHLDSDGLCALTRRCDLFVGDGGPARDVAQAARLPVIATGRGAPPIATAEEAVWRSLADRLH